MPTYRKKYARYKDEVDAVMGKPRGRWARFKSLFAPNSMSAARKQAIDNAQAAEEARALSTYVNSVVRAAIQKMKDDAETLYRTENIIGSTRAPGQRPTVYYRSRSGRFGHITQDYDLDDYIGREPAYDIPGYNYGNTGPNGVMEEKIGDVRVHFSRNPFVAAETEADREALSHAHRDFRDIKKAKLQQAAVKVAALALAR